MKLPPGPTIWEDYSRKTFLEHARLYGPGKLRFLQYVTKATKAWWAAQETQGAVLL